jgi:hypothetical protein
MDTRSELSIAPSDVERKGRGYDDTNGTRNPIRKQPPEERRQYMREYMREYRYRHPGLSTPYVRKYRARTRTDRT